MLQNTFLHIPGIGIKSEQALWEKGIRSWDDLFASENTGPSPKRVERMKDSIKESQEQLQNKNVQYFAARLPESHYWRLFPQFRESTAYVNITTTHRDPWLNSIKIITLYDGKQIRNYVNGVNLDDFADEIKKYSALVTYNGKCFALPFIGMYMGLKLDQVHIDLRYVLNSLGYKGGFTRAEKKVGIYWKDKLFFDPYSIHILWDQYRKTKNQKALEALMDYSTHEAMNLEALMVFAYNLKLKQTPFADSLILTAPTKQKTPDANETLRIMEAIGSASQEYIESYIKEVKGEIN